MTSSPLRPGASQSEELDYYKRQYEQLETDLADFQASSKDLEEQLEKDIDAAEKKERKLKETVEKLTFEVEEWKTKHKQAKAEANNAQNTLQKEITSIREQNRALSLKLRDIEVANDDYERQARNTTSSLEDLESKLNVAIERSVLLEVEVKTGDTEREALRIENQRLRDELGDLKVESEITLEKLRLSGKTIESLRSRKPGNLALQHLRAGSPASEASGRSPLSPTVSTPPPRSDTTSEVPTPPSPPLSDEAAAATGPLNGTADLKTPLPTKRRSYMPDAATTPRPGAYVASRGTTIRHSRGPSLASSTSNTNSDLRSIRPSVASRLRATASPTASGRVTRNESLSQMKSLRLRMQKIEERVQSARSKLPPRDTTPKASPTPHVPSSVTVRRSSKRESSIATGSSADISSASDRRQSQTHVKRLSFGIPRPTSRASNAGERPPSRASMTDRPPSAASRPASRLSVAGNGVRPSSRTSVHEGISRPASAMSGAPSTMSGTPRTHRSSASISGLRQRAAESEDLSTPRTSTYASSRRTTLDKASGLPAPTFARRQSTGLTKSIDRRTSIPAINDGSMPPPPPRRASTFGNEVHDDGDIGETY